MLIAQISDFHVTVPGARVYGQVDTNAALRRAVRTINGLHPEPDLVIGSGDLTQSASPEEYENLTRILGGLKARFLPAVGNHDRRLEFQRSLLSVDPLPYVQYAVDHCGLRIVVLDTIREGSDDPEYCEARTAWLAANLPSDQPTLIVMHHPPFACGIEWLEPADPGWSEPIGALIDRAPNVIGILCGHVHRGIHRTWHGVPTSTAPSTAHQVALDLSPDAPPSLSLEAPGFHLHRWDGRSLTTYAASLQGFSARLPADASGQTH